MLLNVVDSKKLKTVTVLRNRPLLMTKPCDPEQHRTNFLNCSLRKTFALYPPIGCVAVLVFSYL